MHRFLCNALLFILFQPIWLSPLFGNNSLDKKGFETIFLEIKTDSFPTETSWILFDAFNNQILGNNQLNSPDSIYQFSITVGDDVCHKLVILDAGGNGIGGSGYYKIERAGLELVHNYNFTDSIKYHYSGDCGFGDSCSVAAEVTHFVMYGAPLENYWYTITPEEDAFYKITTCLTVDPATSLTVDTETWIYDYCPVSIPQGPVGAFAYSADYNQCSPGSGWNNILLQKDTTYYIRIGLKDSTYTDPIGVLIQENPSIYGCTDPGSCNYNPQANFDDGSCYFNSNCMPDLAIDTTSFLNSIYLDSFVLTDPCLLDEFCVTGVGKRYVVRFSTTISNIGGSDYIIGSPTTNPGNFSNNNCHGHWHDLGYAEYLLFEGAGLPKPLGFKNGFCVMDLGCQQGATAKYNCFYMGLSAGCTDHYEAALDCQWLDVTDVADGNYTLVVRVNWDKAPDWRGFSEINYQNNWAQACINIDRSSGQLQVTVSSSCPTYFDCAGIPNGSAVYDCAGFCGGINVHGDLNGNNGLDSTDISGYYTGILPGSISTSACTDLNGDGQISLFDAVLLQDCYQDKIDNMGYPIHTHCLFPGGVVGLDSVELRLSPNFDVADGFVDIEYYSNVKDLSGFQISLSGLEISQVVPLFNSGSKLVSEFDTNNLLMFDVDSLIKKGLTYQPLARVYFSTITDVKICLGKIVDVLDGNHYKMLHDTSGNCHFLHSTASYSLITDVKTTVFPTLVSNNKFNIVSQQELVGKYELFDYRGKYLDGGLLNETKHQTIEIKHIPKGIFILKLHLQQKSYNYKLLNMQ